MKITCLKKQKIKSKKVKKKEKKEESNLPLEGAPSARLREKEPQQVLDPINCLPVHLVIKHLHVGENTLFNIAIGDGLGRRI